MKEEVNINGRNYVVYGNKLPDDTPIVLEGYKSKTIWEEGIIFAPYIPECIIHFPDVELIENKKGS